jgi:hypothetical protein
MSTKVTIECDARFENGMRRALALFDETEQLALTALDGEVVDQCEREVLEKGRKFQADTLAEAVACRVEAAEERGCRSACARAVARGKLASLGGALFCRCAGVGRWGG